MLYEHCYSDHGLFVLKDMNSTCRCTYAVLYGKAGGHVVFCLVALADSNASRGRAPQGLMPAADADS